MIAAAGLLLVGLLVISGIDPFERGTWLMEVAPIFIVLPLLVATRRRFPLTTLLYGLIFAHACVLMLGGAYTYARVPLGFQLQEWLHLARNPYDRIGHFFQGFVPVIAAREVLLRHRVVRRGPMLVVLLVSVVLAVSACYELIEWAAAMALGAAADDFLGTQGDPWDTQWDMFMALLGASIALLLLSRRHDLQLAGIDPHDRSTAASAAS
jgi:putative membrane protein